MVIRDHRRILYRGEQSNLDRIPGDRTCTSLPFSNFALQTSSENSSELSSSSSKFYCATIIPSVFHQRVRNDIRIEPFLSFPTGQMLLCLSRQSSERVEKPPRPLAQDTQDIEVIQSSIQLQDDQSYMYTIYTSPRNSAMSAFSRGPVTFSNRSTLITNVPLPPVMLRRCLRYPTISFRGTFAFTVRWKLTW